MRVLQLIDSLEPGGAEQMAVSYANALSKRIEKSFLCCTRKEGSFRSKISAKVGYIYLDKKKTLDPGALFKLRNFIIENRINLIQAHGSSFFLAVLVKVTLPDLKLIWHDHLGKRALEDDHPGILKPMSVFFDGVITVNRALKSWAEINLLCGHVRLFKNFLPAGWPQPSFDAEKRLKEDNSLKIICVANLKHPKDHLTLLKAFKLLTETGHDVCLHLVGKDYLDDYSAVLKEYIKQNRLNETVFLHGKQEDVNSFIRLADIGVLSSTSEGLPVSLLEYGQEQIPVVCTDVGDCANVIGAYGKLVPPGNPQALAEMLKFYIEKPEERIKDSLAFFEKIKMEFSEEVVITVVINFFQQIVNQSKELH